MYIIEKYYLLFLIFSVIGWIYESILCSIEQKKIVNRGFLNGPYCPIYGAGALLDVLVLGNIKNPFYLFILGSLLCCSIEYLTSFVLEKLFNARWWDYSKRKFNLKGRICLIGAVVFGIFSIVLVLLLYPLAWKLIEKLSIFWLSFISYLSMAILLSDFIITIIGLAGFEEKIKAFSEFIDEKKNAFIQKLKELNIFKNKKQFNIKGNFKTIFLTKNNVKSLNSFKRNNLINNANKNLVILTYSDYKNKLTAQQRRILRVFPNFKLIKCDNLILKIKDINKNLKMQKTNKKIKTKKTKQYKKQA